LFAYIPTRNLKSSTDNLSDEVAPNLATMKLINTRTLKLTDVFESGAKPYAILSHTWGTAEVSFQEMQSGQLDEEKEGYCKIKNSCRQAALDGYEFNWVDTCCMFA
jgi:hypothetical protein